MLEGVQMSHYRLLHRIGEGGMGDVYLAEHLHLKTQVAIKVIKPSIISNPDSLRLFLREARAIATLDHPHILPLFDYGETTVNGIVYPYIVMPLRSEGSLKTWLKQAHKRSLPDIVNMIKQASSALQHAHDHQVIHLDVKPSNFLIRYKDGDNSQIDLSLTDFGLAKVMNADVSMSNTSRGTPPYMAPEQWKGTPTAASDQYALAVMTYELLTGRTPFVGGSMEELMYQHLHTAPEPPSTFNSSLTPAIDNVILRALEKQPEDRFPSVSDFALAFEQSALPVEGMHSVPSSVVRTTVIISQAEAMVGVKRTLSLPGIQQVEIHIPAGVRDKQVLRIKIQQKTSGDSSPSTVDTLIITVAITSGIEVEHSQSKPFMLTPRAWILAGLAFLLIVASFSTFTIVRNQQNTALQANAASVNKALTSTASSASLANATAAANATATGQANVATAAARTDAVATADAQSVVATETAEVNLYRQATQGKPILDDPLVNNQLGYNWNEIPTVSNGGTCSFIANAYHATQSQSNRFYRCEALSTDYADFAFQVEATIQTGDEAGIVFRFNQALSKFYAFHISVDGAYRLDVDDANGFISNLSNGQSSAMKGGHNQTNVLAVLAKGTSIYIFVNQQYVTSVTDSTYKQGAVGVMAQDDSSPTNVAFTNAKLWKL